MPIAVVIAGALIALAVYFSGGASARPVAQQLDQPSTAVDASSINMDGAPFIGKADAPLVVAYFFDYQCPYCQQNEETSIGPLVKEYVNTGKARLVFKDFAFLGPDSMTLGQWARAVWAYAPEKFYDWHHAVFVNQGVEHSGWATSAEITRISTPILGVEGTAKVAALVKANSATYQKAMDADRDEGSSLGVAGTPAMIVGTQLVKGAVPYAQLKSVIDAQLANQ